MKIADRCKKIRLILSDVDGVLTDGRVIFDNQGIESKQFHIRDGQGIKAWQQAGYQFGIVTGRTSHIVQIRATELGVSLVRQGFDAKLPPVLDLLNETGNTMESLCYIGDDLPDLPIVQQAGLGVTVADGCEELRQAAHYITKTNGGQGAVRELIEMILKAQGLWNDVVARYASK